MRSTGPSWFQRNPKKTLVAFVLGVAASLDLLLGLALIPEDYHSFRCPHYYYHHGWLPNVEGVTIWGKREYPVFSNSLGLADETIRDIPPSSSRSRALFIGDSFTEGVGVTYGESFVGRIDRAVDAYGIDVLNAAVSSYSPKLYYMKTKFLIEREGLEIDQLFVFVDLSDVVDEFVYESFEEYESDLLKRFSLRLRKSVYAHSFTYHTIDDLLFERVAEQNQTWAGGDHWGMPFRRDELDEDLNALRDHPELRARWDVYWTLEDEAFEAWAKTGLALAESSMKKLVDLCREHGIEMTIAVYPWPAQILHGDLESRQVSFWRKFATDHDLGFIDLFPLFVGTSDPPDAVYRRYYINGDIHWSAEGHRAVAEAVLEAADFSRREPRGQDRHRAPSPGKAPTVHPETGAAGPARHRGALSPTPSRPAPDPPIDPRAITPV